LDSITWLESADEDRFGAVGYGLERDRYYRSKGLIPRELWGISVLPSAWSSNYLPSGDLGCQCMSQWLSDDELERISQFANTPGYERSPEMLAPEETEE